ncbi:MAG TPA: histidine phosphatase family protein [Acidimicrobiales bacterium]|jgi:probable phosphoglycerate mutase
MPDVVLLRHGETEWSATGRHTGTTDVPLTDRGRDQARAIGALLRGRCFARVLVSPLRRAAETCRLAGLGGGEVVDDLREWAYGDFEGRTTEEVREGLPGWTVWTGPVPGGEQVDDVGHRADRVIEAVRAVDGDVAVVAHGHLLRVLAARWIGLPAEAGRLLALSTATVSVLGWEREQPVVTVWNQPAPD